MPTEEADDFELMRRVAAGDQAAFGCFVGRHAAILIRLTSLWTRSQEDAEDAAQQALVQLWQRADTFHGDGSPRSFLLAIARRSALRTHRRRVGEPDHLESIDALGEAAGWGAAADSLEKDVTDRELVGQALSRLSEMDREVLILRDVAGVSNQELAETCGISLTQAKGRLHRARLRLLAELERSDEE